ncbi:MAG: hypothetical protein QW039_01265 [Fervidicoccaceae archaeon]
MSVGKVKGINTHGHLGWVTKRCRICGRLMDVTRQIVYKCPTCEKKYSAYFCEADAKLLHYRCPYCKGQLVLFTERLK